MVKFIFEAMGLKKVSNNAIGKKFENRVKTEKLQISRSFLFIFLKTCINEFEIILAQKV
jgi:hypothetical protein